VKSIPCPLSVVVNCMDTAAPHAVVTCAAFNSVVICFVLTLGSSLPVEGHDPQDQVSGRMSLSLSDLQ
jgi:hypothetical protein